MKSPLTPEEQHDWQRIEDDMNRRFQEVEEKGWALFRPCYIYALVDPRDGSVFYVGQSVNPQTRFYGHASTGTRSKRDRIASIRETGQKPKLLILEETIVAERFDRESSWISHYSRMGAPLTNHFDCRDCKPLPPEWWAESRRYLASTMTSDQLLRFGEAFGIADIDDWIETGNRGA